MKAIRNLILFASLLGSSLAHGSGFSLYQFSATANAMGGALVGRAMDASANFINPATLTDLTNIQFSVGFVTEHPRGRVDVDRDHRSLGEHAMDPGAFLLPHAQLAIPFLNDFAFGLGVSPEFGLGTAFAKHWCMRWNCTKTTVESITVEPNLAYRITDDWSVGVGLRWLYFDFLQDSYPNVGMPGLGNFGRFKLHLHGDNDWSDFGWQIGTKYDLLDNLSVGLVYKSQIDVHVKGKSTVSGVEVAEPFAAAATEQIMAKHGAAKADLHLPQSLTTGLNWDITDDWHFGAMAQWSQWSTIDTLVFNLHGAISPRPLRWHDTWRTAVALAYDVNDDWTAMLSYVFDMDSTSSHQCSVMLPPADRHIASCGFVWHVWEGVYLSGCYSCIFMHGGDMHTTDANGDGALYDVSTSRGFCHAGGLTLTYKF